MQMNEYISNYIAPYVTEDGVPTGDVILDIQTFLNSRGGQYYIRLMEVWMHQALLDMETRLTPFVNTQGVLISIEDQLFNRNAMFNRIEGIKQCLKYLSSAVAEHQMSKYTGEPRGN
mgnify:CR=1 FL=1